MSKKLPVLVFVFCTLFFNSISAFGTNPFLGSADQMVTCPSDGTQLAEFVLCGAND